jgi:threonine/homoserine/homoserine lactone efflux protein
MGLFQLFEVMAVTLDALVTHPRLTVGIIATVGASYVGYNQYTAYQAISRAQELQIQATKPTEQQSL